VNDLIFLPTKEEYKPYPSQEFYCEFRLRFIDFAITMFNVDEFKKLMSGEKFKYTKDIKSYALLLAIGTHTWLFYTDDNYETTKKMYRACIDTLKEGDTWEFKDDFGYQNNKPIRLSWQQIRFEW